MDPGLHIDRIAFLKSVFIGAYCGILIQGFVTGALASTPMAELGNTLVLVGVYGLVASPFVATGLLIFGVPSAILLKGYASHIWVAPIAALIGAVAGKVLFYAVDRFAFFGLYDISRISFEDLGSIYGIPTGLAWWFFQGRAFKNRATK